MRHSYCEWCGNAPNECECLTRAEAIVERMFGSGLEAKADAFKEFRQFGGALSDSKWGELIEKRLKALKKS